MIEEELVEEELIEEGREDMAISTRLKLTTHSSREVKSLECPVWWKMTFRISYTPYYKYPYTHEM